MDLRAFGAIVLASVGGAWPAPAAPVADHVTIYASTPIARFSSRATFGASLDGGERGEILPIYTPHNIAAMRSAGLPRVSYRLRTELGIEAWHWNERGSWSDPARQQGYWTGDDVFRPGAALTYGYKLPRRGDTIDQANNAGYSRLDDGDDEAFWKSNPYLDPKFSKAPAASPQWVVMELDEPAEVDAVRIAWRAPYARAYAVQHWIGKDEYDPAGRWVTFDNGQVQDGRGGEVTLKLGAAPVRAKFLRLLLQASSYTPAPGAADPRDAVGYAIAEIGAGLLGADGVLHDVIRHGASREAQTVMHVSSTDPWHRASDLDLDLEQVAPDLMVRSGVTNGLPLMVPVGVLYDTPENAAAELRYLRNAGVPFTQVELGEEPDGQLVSPADYGALYLAFHDALRPAFPGVAFGGPSLQSGVTDSWLDSDPDRSWNGQFVAYLKARGRLGDLGFFSFERYPFDDICGSLPDKLLEQSQMMDELFRRVTAEGVPTTIPWIITEYGFSAFSGRAMVELPSALLNADMVADFLSRGGAAAYLFGYGPNVPINQHLACAGQGNMMLWQADENGQARWPMPALFGARMMTQDWAQPGDGINSLYRAASSVKDAEGTPLVAAYPLRRPDGDLALLLINRSPDPIRAQVGFKGRPAVAGGVRVTQYSPRQYAWDDRRLKPARDLPPARFALPGWAAPIDLPGLSLTVVRGR